MKPSPFRYHRPRELDEALTVLAEVGDHGKVLAGGQSLIPLLNMRLAAPADLVDINALPGLDRVEVTDRSVRIGATVRHRQLERDDDAYAANPLLRQALVNVAHPVIRNRGTTVGSIAHADPAGEMPAVMALLDGVASVASAEGTRDIAAADLFEAPLESAIRPGELVTHVTFQNPGPRTGTAFIELARRSGDYAMAGVGVVLSLDPQLRIEHARAGFIGVGSVPIVVDLTETCQLQLQDAADFTAAVTLARERIEPEDDIHATADYRRHLAGVLTDRALHAAMARAVTTAKREAEA